MLRKADLSPPLGKPGGPCQVIQRVHREVRNPSQREEILHDLETGEDLTNAEASKVYSLDREDGVGPIDAIVLTAHAQYRMDLRGITLADLRGALADFVDQLERWQRKGDPAFTRMIGDIKSGRKVEWKDPTDLKVVFEVRDRMAYVVTTFRKGAPDPRIPRGGCPLPNHAAQRVVNRFLHSA